MPLSYRGAIPCGFYEACVFTPVFPETRGIMA